jgi:CheY-like chemotaxis protein
VDYDLLDGKGARLVRQLRALEDPTPVVAISAHAAGNEALLEAGANVACPKAEKDRLPEVLGGLLGPVRAQRRVPARRGCRPDP